MARQLSTIAEHLPVLREFVEAVSERDPHMIQACLHYTPPGTLAQIAAEWIAVLLAEADERDIEIARLQRIERAIPGGDLMRAYRIAHEKRQSAEARNAELEHELAEARRKVAALMRQRRDEAA